MRELRIRGVEYCVHEWGDVDAPPIVYLHGWGDTGSTFQFVVDAFSTSWRVIAPDWRGFGRSAVDCTSYWFPDYLADLDELLRVYVPGVPARLVGHSMGANIAALYAGTMPERVGAFVNIEGFGLADSNPDDAPRRYRLWITAQASVSPFAEYDDLEVLASRIRKRNPRMSDAAAAFVAAEWAEVDGNVRLRADPRHRLPNPVLYRRAEAEACWRAMTADTVLVTGSESALAEEARSALESLYTDSVQVEDAGHMLHFEAPTRLAAVIEQLFGQHL